MTEEDLAEWRAAPVADEVRAALRAWLAEQRAICMDAAWFGRPWPEAERHALHRANALLEYWFTASAQGFKEMMGIEE